MKICFVTPELTPLAKVGGLADVSAALPRALAAAGHEVRVILPFYRDMVHSRPAQHPLENLSRIPMTCGDRSLEFTGFRGTFPGTTEPAGAGHPELILIACDEMFNRTGIYGDTDDEFLRFLTLSRAAIECCQRLDWAPDVMHCNDWQTALVPLLLRTVYSWDRMLHRTKTVLTIHNIGHQGVFPSDVVQYFDLGDGIAELDQDELNDGRVNYLKTGILHADAITTVSPTYAEEIQTEEYGVGLGGLLTRRRSDLHGILNGIDAAEWNPATDPLIPASYDVDNLAPKRDNKRQLQHEMGVYVDLHAPTIGIVSRLTGQKGFDLMFDVLPDLLRHRELRLLVLGSGEPKYVDFFTQLRRRHPSKVGFYHGFNNELAHLIEAGADMFLMPSLYEPCGLNQMYSQLYGTVPIVRATGGLADTVVQFNPDTGEGTGIVFDHYDSGGLHWALEKAIELYRQPSIWTRLVQNGMRQDFSWGKQAEAYVSVYERIRAGMPQDTASNEVTP